MKHPSRSAELSPQAQHRLAELAELLNPLGRMIAKAKTRRIHSTVRDWGGSSAAYVDHELAGDGNAVDVVGLHTVHPNDCRDIRFPPPGSMLRRTYKGRDLIVTILESGFEFEDRRYRSLSAIAKAVTGAHWNGLLFFGLITQEK